MFIYLSLTAEDDMLFEIFQLPFIFPVNFGNTIFPCDWKPYIGCLTCNIPIGSSYISHISQGYFFGVPLPWLVRFETFPDFIFLLLRNVGAAALRHPSIGKCNVQIFF